MRIKNIFKKEKTEREAINRIIWDPSLHPEDFEIVFLDRAHGKELEERVNVSEIEVVGDFFNIKGRNAKIPFHRVRKILFRGRIVWERSR
ncbi:MAG TPA: DUF504 domain-containing protein [Candidatus Altiarchaeales archaeon]|nr:MAG: hypothetical protein DRO65_01035 [Candidatus Altiarchaeales archaeon]HDN83862.1 DUF504 domain-containing protein [Candidatus Altiarchaeales archaeon]